MPPWVGLWAGEVQLRQGAVRVYPKTVQWAVYAEQWMTRKIENQPDESELLPNRSSSVLSIPRGSPMAVDLESRLLPPPAT